MARHGSMVCSIIKHGITNIQKYMSPHGHLHTQHKTCVKVWAQGKREGQEIPKGGVHSEDQSQTHYLWKRPAGGEFYHAPRPATLNQHLQCHIVRNARQGEVHKCACTYWRQRQGRGGKKHTTCCPPSHKRQKTFHFLRLPLWSQKNFQHSLLLPSRNLKIFSCSIRQHGYGEAVVGIPKHFLFFQMTQQFLSYKRFSEFKIKSINYSRKRTLRTRGTEQNTFIDH